ncbi:MAG: Omp28-related outer membrane protein, partial [Bacteroidales bacterium]|nr:Omp28-related outer membrane protein [Bacteroidales bacterium]
MKRKIISFFTLLTAFAFILSAAAQHHPNTIDGRQKTLSVKNSTPNAWGKSSKDVIFYEDFSDGGFDNWTVMGEGLENWSESGTNNAGGDIPEAKMHYNPVFSGASRLVSPVINTSGYSVLSLSFLNNLDLWSGGGGFWVGVETTSDGGTTWNQVWELYWETNDDYWAFEVMGINTPDVGSENFQFCFKYEDNSDLLDAWYFDNITLGDALVYDVSPVSIEGIEGFIYSGEELLISSNVQNQGLETVTFDVSLEIHEGVNLVMESTKTITDLSFNETINLEFDAWIADEGFYTATVTTFLTGDENPDNDLLAQNFIIYSTNYYCIPGGDCSVGDGLTSFTFADIENYNSGCSNNGYGNFGNLVGNVQIGYPYTCTLQSGYSTQFASIWIDANMDMEFTSDELILTDFSMADAGTTYELEITIPPTFSMTGTTTMRVGVSFENPSSPDPCANFTYGEWEDYTINMSGTQVSQNVGVVSIDLDPVYVQGDIVPVATIKNYGSETVSFPVTCSISDIAYSSTLNVTDLAYGEEVVLEFDTWEAETNVYTLEILTELEGDEVPENDLMEKVISVVDYAPAKGVIGEEATGTWCGYCVKVIVYMDAMKMKYPANWIGTAIHYNDPMEDEEYNMALQNYILGYPSGLVDRASGEIDPEDFEEYVLESISKVAPAELTIENKEYNAVTEELSFTLTASFVAPVSDYRLNAVIIENEVTGTDDGWAQYNAYAGGANGPMGGFENLPDPIPAEDMVYQDVARALLGGWHGVEGSLPATVNAGETHSYDFTITLSDDWDINHLEIVGMLIDNATGEIENATKDEALITGVPTVDANSLVIVYPNPAKDEIRISNIDQGNIYIYNLNG